MSLIEQELSFIGAPILFDNICLIKPTTVGQRIIQPELYSKSLSLLCISDEDIEDILIEKVGAEAQYLSKISPFEYLMLSAEVNETFLIELKKAFCTFIQEEIFIVPKAKKVFIGKIQDDKYLDEQNFPRFQEILRIQNHLDCPEEIPENEDPMHKKFRLRRKMVKQAKQKQNSKDENAPTFLDLMTSLCVMNIGVTWNNIKDLPIFTFYELLSRNQIKEKYDLDVKSLLAGADSKKIKLKYWISHKEDE